MDTQKKGWESTDAYIASFPPATRALLDAVRAAIREAAPDAVEKIAYQMPTFHQHENLIHFAAFTHHIGIYPTSSGVAAFADELTSYTTSRGAIQLPMDAPLPIELIQRITRFRVAEAAARRTSRRAGPRPPKVAS